MNYVKSELYRVLHSKGIYVLAGIGLFLILLMNILLYGLKIYDNSFAYAATFMPFGVVEGMQNVVFMLSAVIGILVFADEFKNGTIINSISYNGSRLKLYFGKIIAGFILSVAFLALALGVLIGSAYLLLENSGNDALMSMLKGYTVNIPNFLTAQIGAITLAFLFKSAMAGMWSWVGIFVVLPSIVKVLGLKFEICNRLVKWFSYGITGESVPSADDAVGNVMLYMTDEGLRRCLIAGAAGIVIFIIIGCLGLRKKEI